MKDRKAWSYMSQQERDNHIERFEQAMLLAFGHFPIKSWMNA